MSSPGSAKSGIGVRESGSHEEGRNTCGHSHSRQGHRCHWQLRARLRVFLLVRWEILILISRPFVRRVSRTGLILILKTNNIFLLPGLCLAREIVRRTGPPYTHATWSPSPYSAPRPQIRIEDCCKRTFLISAGNCSAPTSRRDHILLYGRVRERYTLVRQARVSSWSRSGHNVYDGGSRCCSAQWREQEVHLLVKTQSDLRFEHVRQDICCAILGLVRKYSGGL